MRVVVDNSVWVSAVLSRTGAAHRVYIAFAEGRFTLVTSVPILAETEDVLERPRTRRRRVSRTRAARIS